jgi:MSHA pilin protein MshD
LTRSGFVLAEVSVTLLVLSLAVVALVPVFAMNIRSGKSSERAQEAVFLSQELLDEVRLRKWDEGTPLPTAYVASGSATLGTDTGESGTDKTTFDDVDDFNGWTESPAKDPLNRSITGFAGYTRSVTVAYVTSALAASGTPTDYKQITVCTQIKNRPSACLSTLSVNR